MTFTPRKPRRVALISTKRKSPIKNGSTRFETQHDANNLDKNLSSNASMILDQNLGEKASIDLGLEATGKRFANDWAAGTGEIGRTVCNHFLGSLARCTPWMALGTETRRGRCTSLE